MRAVAGAGSLDSDGDLISTTRIGERRDVPAPFSFVEIGSEKPAGVVRKQRINAHDVRRSVQRRSTEVALDRRVIHAEEGLVHAGRAFHPWFFANAAPPLIGAGRRIAAAPRFRILPAEREYVHSAAEEPPKQAYLGRRRRLTVDVLAGLHTPVKIAAARRAAGQFFDRTQQFDFGCEGSALLVERR